MYPALVNCTTIDLFNEWPPEALLEVGERYLANVELDDPNLKEEEKVNEKVWRRVTMILFFCL